VPRLAEGPDPLQKTETPLLERAFNR